MHRTVGSVLSLDRRAPTDGDDWQSMAAWSIWRLMPVRGFRLRLVHTVRLGAFYLVMAGLLGCKRAEQAGASNRGTPQAATASSAVSTSASAGGARAETSADDDNDSGEPDKAKLRRPYNILLLMIDSLRADMPWTGYGRPIAPRLTEFAKSAVVYPRAYSISSYTAKSVAPALAGKYPSEMARDGRFFTRWLPENVLVSELLKEKGFATLAGHGHGYFMPGLGLEQGFTDYQLLKGTFLDPTGVHDINSHRLYELAKDMLSKPELSGESRFFAYFHFLDPHHTYNKHADHPDFGDDRRDLYDNEVHFTDYWIGKLLDFISEQPWGKQTAIIITADHGEGFGERGRFRHAYDVWESLVRVPLLIRIPGAEGRRIQVPRGHIDLAPTILDLAGLAPPADLRGQSLVPELIGEEARLRPILVDLPRCDLMDSRRAFIDGDYKLISFGDDAAFELFNVVKDFEEKKELSKTEPELFRAIKAKYLELTAKVPTRPVSDSVPLKGAPAGRRW